MTDTSRPTVKALIRESRTTQGYSEGDLRSLVKSLAAALEAQSTELARDVAHREEVERQLSAARNVYPNIREALAERDAARAQIAEVLAEHRPIRNYTSGATDPKHVASYETRCGVCGSLYPCYTVSRALHEGVATDG